MFALLEKLCTVTGPAGFENNIRAVIQEEAEKYVSRDQIFTDTLGNLVVSGGNTEKKKIMIAAHMDEIGFLVTYIEKEGFLRFSAIGGHHVQYLPGKRVIFTNKTVGVMGQEKLKDTREPEINKLYIDIGAKSKEEALKKVKPGDAASFLSPCSRNGREFMAKALDDRAGCAVLLETMKRLPPSLSNGVHFVFTVQEELGLRGAVPVAYRLKPDFGLAVDVTRVGDTPEPEYKMDVSLGKGPAVKLKDSSLICHPMVTELMIRTAEKNNIPYQLEVLERGGTDAGAIHLSREGVPTGAISIPCRYIHSPSEMVSLTDMENAVALIIALLQEEW